MYSFHFISSEGTRFQDLNGPMTSYFYQCAASFSINNEFALSSNMPTPYTDQSIRIANEVNNKFVRKSPLK